jgi:tRNA G18 (ribose-2'-O)-methylase SpoU
MDRRVESLNVGVACGALSYLWRRQWPAREEGGGRREE